MEDALTKRIPLAIRTALITVHKNDLFPWLITLDGTSSTVLFILVSSRTSIGNFPSSFEKSNCHEELKAAGVCKSEIQDAML